MEIMVVAIIALIVFGPEKLPEMARKVGNFAADLRRVSTEVRGEFRGALGDDDDNFDPQDDKMTEASETDEAERVASLEEPDPEAPENAEGSEEAGPSRGDGDGESPAEPSMDDSEPEASVVDPKPEGPIVHKRTRRPRPHEDR